jgi:hypothetical protein
MLWQTSKEEWTDSKQAEYNKCDEQHIKGMLSAEKKTCKKKLYDWSPKFSKAIETKAFWKINLALRRNHIYPNHKLLAWADTLNIKDIHTLPESRIKAELRLAQRNLREIKTKAKELREQHLRDLISEAIENSNDKTHERRLQILLRAHTKQRSFKRIQQALRPTARSGLAYVTVPGSSNPQDYPYDPDQVKTWEMIHDQQRLQEFLIKRNTVHFSQAHGTPFTKEPLNKLDWNACSKEAENLLQGNIPHEINHPNRFVKAILESIAKRPQLPEIDTYIPPEEVAQGFRRWKESTSTSPSGCHLGLRRIPAIPTMETELENIRTGILGIQTHIINIPIAHGFSPLRWQTVINAMLEKVPGNPLLHELHVIHILEADHNLTLKAIFGRRLLYNCKEHGVLGDLQDGFRKGRSTTQTLLHNKLINDYNKRL